MIKLNDPNARTIGQIIDAVELAAGVPRGMICALHHRTHSVSLARHVAYYIVRRETKLSFATIARSCGGAVDHKGVLYGFNRIALARSEGSADGDTIRLIIGKVAPDLLVRP